MKAVVYDKYGPPDVLHIEEIDKPTPADDQVLVRVKAASLNPYDWHYMRGTPYLFRLMSGLFKPKNRGIGADLAGIVEAVGRNVSSVSVGDEVFGDSHGALAEYVLAKEKPLAPKPSNLTFEQTAAIPIAGLTALQGLRDYGKLQQGDDVLINGASGGVGTFAVQIAKSFGANVTAVCSGRNAEMVRSIGADRVIDYTKEDFVTGEQKYDVILDNIGNRKLAEYRRLLKRDGAYVVVGSDSYAFGPLVFFAKMMIYSLFVKQTVTGFVAKLNRDDLVILKDMCESGTVTPVIDREYALDDISDAMTYLETKRVAGKVVVTV